MKPITVPSTHQTHKGLKDPDYKRHYNKNHFDIAAGRYDIATRCLSLFQDRRWKENIVNEIDPKKAGHILDLACGSGDVCFLISEKCKDAEVVGIDISPVMLKICAARAEKKEANVRLVEGDIAQLPFEDGSFQVVTASYALRNSPSLEATIKEVHRVLQPGGTFIILDFAKPSRRFAQWFQSTLLTFWGGLWGLLLHGDPQIHSYIGASLRTYLPQERVIDLIEREGMRIKLRKRFMAGATELLLFER